MPRTLLVCAALLALAAPVRADATVTPSETVIRLNVYPMAAPKPALRYLLLPDLKEMTPGNPIPNYLKCLLEQDFSSDRETFGAAALRRADHAARMDKPDWELLPRLKTDGIGLLLPDLQKMRALAQALKERFHQEVAARRFDDAIYTARTMFALARHTGEHPTLIGDLVAVAIATITIGPLEAMLEQPGCPNLYWALTNLPTPFVSIAKGLEGERALIRGEFRELDDREPMSREQIDKLIFHIDSLRRMEGKFDKETDGARAWIDRHSRNDEAVRAARRRLVEYGIPEERLARFPTDQVILLDGWRGFEVNRDELMKTMNLPTWQVEALTDGKAKPDEPSLFDEVLPALIKVRRAQGRLEQRVALLRCVEALRLYAAGHEGRLPEKLADCPVPIPDDPFTGKPFRYEVDGATAHLRGTPPRGEAKSAGYNIHYILTIQN